MFLFFKKISVIFIILLVSACSDSQSNKIDNGLPTVPIVSIDTDADGTDNDEDLDDDNDGYSDVIEATEGTDPLLSSSKPADLDGDFIPDSTDSDIDGDTVLNEDDAFPRDPTKVYLVHQSDLSLNYQLDKLTIRWQSKFDNELGYEVHLKPDMPTALNNEWEIISTLGPVTNGQYVEKDIPSRNGQYRVLATFDSENKILSSDNGTSDLQFNNETAADLSILLPETPQPYEEQVQFELSANVIVSSWFIDTITACRNSNVCTENSLLLNTSLLTDGTHRLDAKAEIAPSVFVYLQSTINIYNPQLTARLAIREYSDSSSIFLITATSKAAITAVEFIVDGEIKDIQLSETPIIINECNRWGCQDITYPYHWVWPNEYGEHQVQVNVTDSDGEQENITQALLINQAPSIVIDTPKGGQLIQDGNLIVKGVITNENEIVTSRVLFGDIEIGVKQGTGSFEYHYPLNGLPDGDYMISVQATDEFNSKTTETISFKYSAVLNDVEFVKAFTNQFIEINDDYALYNQGEYKYLAEDLVNGSTHLFDLSLVDRPTNIHVDNKGNLSFIIYGRKVNYKTPTKSYNISELIQLFGANGDHPSIIENIMVYTGAYLAHIYVVDLETLTFHDLLPPENAPRWSGSNGFHNSEWLCNSAFVGSYNNYNDDLYLYHIPSESFSRVTTNGKDIDSFCVGLDEYSVAYTTLKENVKTLYLTSLSNPSNIKTLTNDISGTPKHSNGVTAWNDSQNNLNLFMSDDNVKIIENARLAKLKNGVVTYTTPTGLYLWEKSMNAPKLIWHSSINHFITSNYIYMISGKLIYKVPIF